MPQRADPSAQLSCLLREKLGDPHSSHKVRFAAACNRPRWQAAKPEWQCIYGGVSSMIPLRNFGKADVKISALGLGGHHLGAAKDEATGVEIVHRALDGGITFYDCCWEYNRGQSED